jgi:hypothetical protein
MYDEVLGQLTALEKRLDPVRQALKRQERIPSVETAESLVELARLAVKLEKVAGEVLAALEQPPLPGTT